MGQMSSRSSRWKRLMIATALAFSLGQPVASADPGDIGGPDDAAPHDVPDDPPAQTADPPAAAGESMAPSTTQADAEAGETDDQAAGSTAAPTAGTDENDGADDPAVTSTAPTDDPTDDATGDPTVETTAAAEADADGETVETTAPEPGERDDPPDELDPTETDAAELLLPMSAPLAVSSSASTEMMTINGEAYHLRPSLGTPLLFNVPDYAGMAGYPPPTRRQDLRTGIRVFPGSFNCFGYMQPTMFDIALNPDRSWSVELPAPDPGYYSFKATVSLMIEGAWVIAAASSNCVNVTVAANAPVMFINGSTEPFISADDVQDLHFGAQFLPADATVHRLTQYPGSMTCGNVAAHGRIDVSPGTTADVTILAPSPGVYSYSISSYRPLGSRLENLGATPCQTVTVTGAAAELRINGEPTRAVLIEGQLVNFFATGLLSGNTGTLLLYEGYGCSGSGYPIGTAGTSFAGVFDATYPLFLPWEREHSFRVATGDRLTNCVDVDYSRPDLRLTVNGSPTSVTVMPSEEFELVATGFPAGSGVYLDQTCSSDRTPTDMGATVGADGIVRFSLLIDEPDDYVAQVVLLDGFAATNCVFITVLDFVDDAVVTIDGTTDPVDILTGQLYTIAASGLPPTTLVGLDTFDGSDDCSGSATTQMLLTGADGSLTTQRYGLAAGPTSYRVDTTVSASNCAVATVLPSPVLTVEGVAGGTATFEGHWKDDVQMELTRWPSTVGTTTALEIEVTDGLTCTGVTHLLVPVTPPPGGTAAGTINRLLRGDYSFRAYGTVSVGGQLIDVTTECTALRIVADGPTLRVNGSPISAEITVDGSLVFVVAGLLATADTLTLNRHAGADCAGEPVAAREHPTGGDPEAAISLPVPYVDPGEIETFSFNVVATSDPPDATPALTSNCVRVEISGQAGGTTTTDPPGGTTEPPGGTTEPPTGTTQPPGGTTEPPTATTQPPGGTTEPPTGTTQPPGGTREPPAGTTQPPTSTTVAPTGTIAPSSTTPTPTSASPSDREAAERLLAAVDWRNAAYDDIACPSEPQRITLVGGLALLDGDDPDVGQVESVEFSGAEMIVGHGDVAVVNLTCRTGPADDQTLSTVLAVVRVAGADLEALGAFVFPLTTDIEVTDDGHIVVGESTCCPESYLVNTISADADGRWVQSLPTSTDPPGEPPVPAGSLFDRAAGLPPLVVRPVALPTGAPEPPACLASELDRDWPDAAAVVALQLALESAGSPTRGIDGSFGPRTGAAIAAFAADNPERVISFAGNDPDVAAVAASGDAATAVLLLALDLACDYRPTPLTGRATVPES